MMLNIRRNSSGTTNNGSSMGGLSGGRDSGGSPGANTSSSSDSPPLGGMDVNDKLVKLLVTEVDELMEKLRASETFKKGDAPSIFNLQPVRIRNWRIKRQDTAISTSFDALFPKLKDSVEKATVMCSIIDERAVVLREQALLLNARLRSCVDYNTEYLLTKANVVDEMRQVIDRLSANSASIKAMITFNVEVIRQKLVQSVGQGRSFMSWGNRAMLLRPISESELGEDPDHSFLIQKLKQIRETREGLMQRLSEMLEMREMHSANLEATSASFDELNEVVKLVEEANTSLEAMEVAKYDHSKCPDCALMPILATQCVDDLNVLLRRQAEARVWLQQLSTCKGKVEKAKVQLDKSISAAGGAEAGESFDEAEKTEHTE